MGDGRMQNMLPRIFFDVFYKQNIYEIISKYVSWVMDGESTQIPMSSAVLGSCGLSFGSARALAHPFSCHSVRFAAENIHKTYNNLVNIQKKHGKIHHFLWGNSTISMAIFNSKLLNCQRVTTWFYHHLETTQLYRSSVSTDHCSPNGTCSGPALRVTLELVGGPGSVRQNLLISGGTSWEIYLWISMGISIHLLQ